MPLSAAKSEIFLAGAMDPALSADLTRVLNDLGSGDHKAVAELLPVVYADLRRLADSFFRDERRDHTLQPTALVHEAYLRLMRDKPDSFRNRAHFFRVAAVVMRHLLIMHARERHRLKRGGNHARIALSDDIAAVAGPDIDLIALDDALNQLSEMDPRKAQVVELRFFAGLTIREAADALGVSERSVEEDWTVARAWLWRELNH